MRKTAQLIIYIQNQLDKPIVPWIIDQASDVYASRDDLIPMLCALIASLNDNDFDRIVYNARSKESRELANWWEEHQEADKQRIKEEEQQKEYERKLKTALDKLTKEERRLLGL